MKRRLVELCVLAYPRGRRERDRAYIRDLTLELSETYGLPRQAASLIRGGFAERLRVGLRPLAAAGCVLIAIGVGVGSLLWPAGGAGERVEVEELACVETGGACAESKRFVAARTRQGWDCGTDTSEPTDGGAVTWRCTLG